MDKATLIGSIVTGQCDDYLSDILEATRTRKQARAMNQPVMIGSKVKLHGLSPSYINGAVCTVTKINPKKFVVSFPVGPQYGRFSGSQRVSVSKTACELVEDVYEID